MTGLVVTPVLMVYMAFPPSQTAWLSGLKGDLRFFVHLQQGVIRGGCGSAVAGDHSPETVIMHSGNDAVNIECGRVGAAVSDAGDSCSS